MHSEGALYELSVLLGELPLHPISHLKKGHEHMLESKMRVLVFLSSSLVEVHPCWQRPGLVEVYLTQVPHFTRWRLTPAALVGCPCSAKTCKWEPDQTSCSPRRS